MMTGKGIKNEIKLFFFCFGLGFFAVHRSYQKLRSIPNATTSHTKQQNHEVISQSRQYEKSVKASVKPLKA